MSSALAEAIELLEELGVSQVLFACNYRFGAIIQPIPGVQDGVPDALETVRLRMLLHEVPYQEDRHPHGFTFFLVGQRLPEAETQFQPKIQPQAQCPEMGDSHVGFGDLTRDLGLADDQVDWAKTVPLPAEPDDPPVWNPFAILLGNEAAHGHS